MNAPDEPFDAFLYRRIAVRERARHHALALDQIDLAPIGQHRNRVPCDGAHRLLDIERGVDSAGRLGEVRLLARGLRDLLLRRVPLFDVDYGSDPIKRRSIRRGDAPPARQVPAIRPPVGAPQPQFGLVRPIVQRPRQHLAVVGMHQRFALRQRRADAEAGKLSPCAVDQHQPLVAGGRHEYQCRHRIGERTERIRAPLHFVDVGAPSDPICNRTGRAAHRNVAAAHVPDLSARVRHAQFELGCLAARPDAVPVAQRCRSILGLQYLRPARAFQLLRGAPGERAPGAIDELDRAVRSGDPEQLRQSIGERPNVAQRGVHAPVFGTSRAKH